MGRRLNQVPRPITSVHPIRRTFSRIFSYNPQLGIDASSNYTMQIAFAPNGSDIRLGGVSVYVEPLPLWSELTALFDQYRIKQVTCRMDYTTDEHTNSGPAYAPPLLSTVVDYDDSNNTDLTHMYQYPSLTTHSFKTDGYKPAITALNPRPLRDVAGYGVLTGYSPMTRAPFIRTADGSIPHYGIKYALGAQGGSVNAIVGYFTLTVYFDIELINPK